MFSSLSRRQLFRLISLVVGGTAVVGSVPFFGNFFASKAQVQDEFKEVYKGREYKLKTLPMPLTATNDSTFDQQIQLFLDDRKIRIVRLKKTNKYVTPLLFGEFNSPQEVARHLIDLGLNFPSGEVNLDPNID
jgi:hypothetical protein